MCLSTLPHYVRTWDVSQHSTSFCEDLWCVSALYLILLEPGISLSSLPHSIRTWDVSQHSTSFCEDLGCVTALYLVM
ncbi:hypothetical protein DPMN_009771 [Dreissena polymorpha]|uniref:Uncharacterized protein n=1 Tax=Dreissena polymorpha TaxID=45954 RepID=A0A9D4N0S7_DREPO|nr:hypothetical protein DPMN_009771 [Dreissena polymorpha]